MFTGEVLFKRKFGANSPSATDSLWLAETVFLTLKRLLLVEEDELSLDCLGLMMLTEPELEDISAVPPCLNLGASKLISSLPRIFI